MKKSNDDEVLSDLWVYESSKKLEKLLIILVWILIGLYLSVSFDKEYVLVYSLFSILFVAICVYAQYVSSEGKSTKVQDEETDISIIFEEDGNTSKTREVDTITRLPVPTPHIRVASFKASPGPEDYQSYSRKTSRSRFDPSRTTPPVSLRQGRRRVDKPPTRTGRASTLNFNCLQKQMKKTALALDYENNTNASCI